MKRQFLRTLAGAGGAALALGGAAFVPVHAAGSSDSTCTGGSIAAGSYNNMTVTGVCFVDSGSVSVKNLEIAPGGWVIAAFGSADGKADNLTTKNVTVDSGGVLVLGCVSFAFPCFNDPNANTNPTYFNTFTVNGNLTATNASAVIVHNGAITQNATVSGGGGGTACNFGSGPLMGNPFYDDFEDNAIGGNLTIQGVSTCWIGVFRDTVARNVTFNNNVDPNSTAFTPPFPPDGNEIATNTIDGNLNCSGNNPTPQFGDSGGSPNIVLGRANGQCIAVVP